MKGGAHRYLFDAKPLGSGAYGSVYGATDTLTSRRVAVKCITFSEQVSTQGFGCY